MPSKRRAVFGVPIAAARIVGLLLIALAIATLPQVRFLIGRFEWVFQLLASIVLLIIGIVWLFGISALIDFFDKGLSRN